MLRAIFCPSNEMILGVLLDGGCHPHKDHAVLEA